MKKAKLISILTTTLMVIFALTTVVSATTSSTYGKIGNVEVNVQTGNATNIATFGGRIIGIIRVVGTLIAVGMVLILGIKYMTGSAEEKAANKKSMVPYLVGAVLLFIGVQVVSAIYTWSNSVTL